MKLKKLNNRRTILNFFVACWSTIFRKILMSLDRNWYYSLPIFLGRSIAAWKTSFKEILRSVYKNKPYFDVHTGMSLLPFINDLDIILQKKHQRSSNFARNVFEGNNISTIMCVSLRIRVWGKMAKIFTCNRVNREAHSVKRKFLHSTYTCILIKSVWSSLIRIALN